MIKVLVVDDMKILRECIKLSIERNSDFEVAGCAQNGYEAIDMCKTLAPDVVLMDLNMPECSGIDAIMEIKAYSPKIKILVLTTHGDEKNVSKAVANGADGYVLKDIGVEELLLAIKSVYMGLNFIHRDAYSYSKPISSLPTKKAFSINGFNIELTKRENDIISLIAEGKTNEEISASLNISEGRTANVVTDLISKLMLKNRTQLAVFAIKSQYDIKD